MSERPSWMPSDAAMDKARVESALLREALGPDSDDNEPLRILISTAVEKALAEQEARHKREVIEAQLRALFGLPLVGNGRGFWMVREERLTEIMETLRAELAALDKEGS